MHAHAHTRTHMHSCTRAYLGKVMALNIFSRPSSDFICISLTREKLLLTEISRPKLLFCKYSSYGNHRAWIKDIFTQL